MSCFKGIFEASIITVDEFGEPTYPYYCQPVLNQYISEYLEEKVKMYVTDYSLAVTYYETNSTAPCSINGKPTIVEIGLKAKINYFYNYEKTQTFSIDQRSIE